MGEPLAVKQCSTRLKACRVLLTMQDRVGEAAADPSPRTPSDVLNIRKLWQAAVCPGWGGAAGSGSH